MIVECLKGNKYIGIRKGVKYPVIDVYQMGADFGHNVRIVLQHPYEDKRFTLYVPMVHKNRLSAPDGFNVNKGDVTQKARVRFVGEFSVR